MIVAGQYLYSLEPRQVELAAAGQAPAEVVELRPLLGAPPESPVRVHGRVTLDGEPMPGAVISFVPADGAGLDKLKVETLDAAGRYELQLDAPGDYLLTVQSASTPGRQNSIEFRRRVPEGEETRLDLELPLGRISGRVEDSHGEPVSGARVTVTMQGGLVFGTVFGGHYTETATDGAGAYDSTAPCATPPVTSSRRPRSSCATRRDAWSSYSLASTNASGTFEYPGLAPGEYGVAARTRTLASAATVPVRVRSDESSEVPLVLEPGTILLVSLEDSSGADIPARVSVLDDEGRERNGMLGLAELVECYSGGLGEAVQRVGPLPAGTYQVRASAEDGRSAHREVSLTG